MTNPLSHFDIALGPAVNGNLTIAQLQLLSRVLLHAEQGRPLTITGEELIAMGMMRLAFDATIKDPGVKGTTHGWCL